MIKKALPWFLWSLGTALAIPGVLMAVFCIWVLVNGTGLAGWSEYWRGPVALFGLSLVGIVLIVWGSRINRSKINRSKINRSKIKGGKTR